MKVKTKSIAILAGSVMAIAAITPVSVAFSAQDADKPVVHVVERGDLTLSVNQTGRIDSRTRVKVTADLEAFGGQLEVNEIKNFGGKVNEGDTILVFNTEKVDEAIEKAEIALEKAYQNYDFVKKELAVLVESNQVRVERAQASKTAAEHAFEIFDQYDGDKMLRMAELGLMQSEYRLADQREELAQLEAMYDDTTLASETKEIVLERNRRQVRISEEYLKYTRQGLLITQQYRYPDRKVAVENDLRWRALELDHAITNAKISEARKQTAANDSGRVLEDAKEKLDKLYTDKENCVVKASASGVMTSVSIKPGDTVSGKVVIAEIVDPDNLTATFNASPEDLRVITQGSKVILNLPYYGEVALTGEVESIAMVGKAANKNTQFPVTVKISSSHPLVRVGMDCTFNTSSTLAQVYTVPKKCVHDENGEKICYVLKNGTAEKQTVTVGASNNDSIQIVTGLATGDEVLLSKPK